MEYNGIRSYKSDEKQGQIISYLDKTHCWKEIGRSIPLSDT